MGNLEKFAQLARPDKILMVGEALVGTDSVAQARAFNRSFGPCRGLDGFVISKCDTVGEMVGVLVSMVHATGIPVVFLGVGQHYGDLRTLVSFFWWVEKGGGFPCFFLLDLRLRLLFFSFLFSP